MFLGLIYSRLTAANNSLYVEEHIRGQSGKALLHIVSELERKFASLDLELEPAGINITRLPPSTLLCNLFSENGSSHTLS